ncbi:MAG: glycosyltransferase [Candidatus Bathyarchaeota archaeon]
MRVLVFTPSYPRYPGDYHGSFIQALCRRLSRHVELTVLAPRSRTMEQYTEPYKVKRFPYLPWRSCELVAERTMVDAPGSHLIQLPAYLLSAYLHHVKDEYDLVHTHLAIPFGLLASHNPRRVPQLVTCHGSDLTLPSRNAIYVPATRHTLRRADHVVTVSRHLERLVHRLGALPGKTETIYTGVDVERFRPDKRNGPQTIGTLGRVIPGKNMEDLLRAVSLLQGSRDVRLLVGGDGPHLLALKRLSLDLGLRDTHFLGRVHDAPGFHRLCDVFALASVNEGLSVSLQEAMASGCVPVAANAWSSREVIIDGVDGFLYRPRDFEALASRLEVALNAPDMGVKARETMVSGFNLDANYMKYLDAYERALR